VGDINPNLHARMKVDLKQCMENARLIMANRNFSARLQQAYKLDLPPPKDVFGTIYSGGFFSRGDTARRDRLHVTGKSNLPMIASMRAKDILHGAEDTRIEEMAIRLQGLSFPQALTNPEDHGRFVNYLGRRLRGEDGMGLSLAKAREEINLCGLDRILTEDDEAVIADLSEHLDWLEEQAILARTLPLALGEEPPHSQHAQPEQKSCDDTAITSQGPVPESTPVASRRRSASPFPSSLMRQAQTSIPAPASIAAVVVQSDSPCPF